MELYDASAWKRADREKGEENEKSSLGENVDAMRL